MDWDGNQEEIRKMMARAEALVGEMVYEPDPEARGELSLHILRDIADVLAKTENMSRWLKDFEEKMVTPSDGNGIPAVLSYEEVVEMYKRLREDYRLLEKQIRGD